MREGREKPQSYVFHVNCAPREFKGGMLNVEVAGVWRWWWWYLGLFVVVVRKAVVGGEKIIIKVIRTEVVLVIVVGE